MVLAFAGLSTITSFFDMARDTLAACWDTPRRGAAPQSRLHACRGIELAAALRRLPAPRARPRAPPERGLRSRGEPQLQPRPLAPRTAPVPAPLPSLHGQVGALLASVQAVRDRGRRLPGPPRRTRHRRDRDCRATLPRGPRRRDVPRGHATEEGAPEEVRGARPHRRGQDRARGGRTPGPGRHHRHRPARAPGAAAGGVGTADPDRRPGGAGGRGAGRNRAADDRDRGARALGVKTLLIVDGDSFAHRYYHALPKSIRRADGGGGNLLDGVGGLLVRLWDEESPRAVIVAWDTLTVPTYRHTALPAYQSGREFDRELLDQLDLAPQLVEAMGFAAAKADGYEADDFLAAAVAFESARGGTALVASGDRDTFQLVGERTTVLQPQTGGGPLARIGPAEVRERYGVEPAQVPDFIALRGDPSDRIPGARGVGPKTAASLLAQYGSLETALDEGRFAAEAESLRLYRHIATMDPEAPLPPLEDQRPTWDRAAALAEEWGLARLAGRLGALSTS